MNRSYASTFSVLTCLLGLLSILTHPYNHSPILDTDLLIATIVFGVLTLVAILSPFSWPGKSK